MFHAIYREFCLKPDTPFLFFFKHSFQTNSMLFFILFVNTGSSTMRIYIMSLLLYPLSYLGSRYLFIFSPCLQYTEGLMFCKTWISFSLKLKSTISYLLAFSVNTNQIRWSHKSMVSSRGAKANIDVKRLKILRSGKYYLLLSLLDVFIGSCFHRRSVKGCM